MTMRTAIDAIKANLAALHNKAAEVGDGNSRGLISRILSDLQHLENLLVEEVKELMGKSEDTNEEPAPVSVTPTTTETITPTSDKAVNEKVEGKGLPDKFAD